MGDEEDGDEEVDGMSRVGMGKGAEVEVESGDDSRSKAEICRIGEGEGNEDEQGDGDGERDGDGSRHTEDRVAVKPTEKPVDISHRPAGSLEVLVGHHYSRYQPLHIPTTP